MNLSSKLDRVEKYGFSRSEFPIKFNQHDICIIQNDAYDKTGIHADFSLYCRRCERSADIYGHVTTYNPRGISLVKLYLFGAYTDECDG